MASDYTYNKKRQLAKKFFTLVEKDFAVNGEVAISTYRELDPGGYLKLVASTLPKDDPVNVQHSGSVTLSTLPISDTAEFLGRTFGPGAGEPSKKPS